MDITGSENRGRQPEDSQVPLDPQLCLPGTVTAGKVDAPDGPVDEVLEEGAGASATLVSIRNSSTSPAYGVSAGCRLNTPYARERGIVRRAVRLVRDHNLRTTSRTATTLAPSGRGPGARGRTG